MRSRTDQNAFAQVALRSEWMSEQPRAATYHEMAAAIFQALAESGQEDDPTGESAWDCEIELLDEYSDMVAQVPDATNPRKQ